LRVVPAGKHFPEEQNQFDDLSSFSVFDGHGGVKTKFFVSIQMR
jgi:serine/threonine protein phosphatase PrpC